MTNAGQDQIELKTILRSDLSSFIQKTFTFLSPGSNYQHNWHIDAIAHHLQEVLDGKVTRLIITMPPRSLKSIATSVAFPAFALGQHPAIHIINACYSDDLATMHARHRRQVMGSSWFRDMFPGTRISKIKDSETEFVTTANGGCYATSVGGTLTGRGADIIIIDDPVKVGEASSEAVRKQVNRWYRETLYTRLNNKKTGAIIIVMQRIHEDDLIGHVLDLDDWTVLNLPAIATEPESIPIGRDQMVERLPGDLLHAEREDIDTLEKIKLTISSYAFEAQYQQNPLPLAGNVIKRDWFKRYGPVISIDVFEQIVQSWDTASETGDNNDYSVCTTWGVRENKFYLLDVLRERLKFPDLVRAVDISAREYHADAILIERADSGRALAEVLFQNGRRNVMSIKPEGDKVTRVLQQSHTIESGRVFIPQDAPWLAEFEHEVLAFPQGKHDDQVDSMTQFLRWIIRDPIPELEVRITEFGSSGSRDRYYERMGTSVFGNLFE